MDYAARYTETIFLRYESMQIVLSTMSPNQCKLQKEQPRRCMWRSANVMAARRLFCRRR